MWPTILNTVLVIFGTIAAGAVVRRINWLTAEADASLLALVIRLLLPCLILSKSIGNPLLSIPANLIYPPLVGVFTVAMGFGLAWVWPLVMRRHSGLADEKQKRTFSLGVGLYNYGYIPIPLAVALWGEESLGVLFIHNFGVELAMWTLGVLIITGGVRQMNWRQLINPPALAIVLAVVLNLSGIGGHIPNFVMDGLTLLGQATIPLGLVLVGATIADHMNPQTMWQSKSVMVGAALLRLGVLPIIALLLAKELPLSVDLKRVIVLQAAMPAAVFPIVMAKHFGGDVPTALRVGLGTSVLSLITMTWWITFGISYLNV